ncbi:MAG TPA: tetratricopeptide repeat protein, partial [Thermoanaerobaculia bacterium]|nr:tetratricopeptide repeat protein [Thermoanaerobaculia bacterium]
NPGNPGSASPAKPQSPAVPDPIMALVEKGQFEQALNLVREQIKLEPKDLGPRILEMRLLLLLKRPQEALKSAQAMVDLAPGSADAIYARGVCRLALEQPKEGEEDLRQALKIQPGYLPAMNDLAVVLMVRGEKKEAQSLLEKVLAANPNDKVAAENLRKLKAEGKAGG